MAKEKKTRARSTRHVQVLERLSAGKGAIAPKEQGTIGGVASGDPEEEANSKKRARKRKRDSGPGDSQITPSSTGAPILVPVQAKQRSLVEPPAALLQNTEYTSNNQQSRQENAIEALQSALASDLSAAPPQNPEVEDEYQAVSEPEDEEMEDGVPSLDSSTPTSAVQYSSDATGPVPGPSGIASALTVSHAPESSLKGKEREGNPIGSENTTFNAYLEALYHSGSEKAAYQTVCALLQRLITLEENQAQAQVGAQVPQMATTQVAMESNSGTRVAKKNVPAANNPDIPWDQTVSHMFESVSNLRDPELTALQGYICQLFYQKLDRDGPTNPLPPTAPSHIAEPTGTSFYIRYEESENSEFNQTAAHIIVKEVKQDWPNIYARVGGTKLLAMITAHIKYLKKTYDRQNDPEVMSKEEVRRRRCAADTRKRTLYHQRVRAISEIPGLYPHGRLIAALGIDGTSSDEEDADHRGTYTIKRCQHLCRSVNHLKGQIDQAYVIHFKGPGSKGNQVRKRVDRGVVSKRPFTAYGLPSSCVDPVWFSKLSDLKKELHGFVEGEYDYKFPVEMLQPL